MSTTEIFTPMEASTEKTLFLNFVLETPNEYAVGLWHTFGGPPCIATIFKHTLKDHLKMSKLRKVSLILHNSVKLTYEPVFRNPS